MKYSSLELWTTPALGVPSLDHTFIRCPEEDAYFYCFDPTHMDVNTSGARRILSVSPNPNVYQRANSYRTPKMGLPDTSGLGVYGINGVCHQAANCFLHAFEKGDGTRVQIPLAPSSESETVRGYVVSYLIYGAYGSDPGKLRHMDDLREKHYEQWLDEVYEPALEAHPAATHREGTQHDDMGSASETSTFDKRIRDLAGGGKRAIGDMFGKWLETVEDKGEKLCHRGKSLGNTISKRLKEYFADGHFAEFIDCRNKVLAEISALVTTKSPTSNKRLRIKLNGGRAAEQLLHELNGRIVQFQNDLKRAMGEEMFSEVTGHRESLEIVHKDIALRQWEALKDEVIEV